MASQLGIGQVWQVLRLDIFQGQVDIVAGLELRHQLIVNLGYG